MTWQSFKQAWLIRFWSPVPAVIAAGILSTYYFGITGTFWAVTGEFTRWGGQLLQLLGVHSEQWGYYQLIHLEGSPLTRIDGSMIIGMFGGCETGWMYRAVEGQVHYWWVGLGNVIGSTLLAWCWDDIAAPLATHWQKVNLLNAFGPFGGLLATYLLLLIALLLVIAWERHFFRRQAAVRTVKESA